MTAPPCHLPTSPARARLADRLRVVKVAACAGIPTARLSLPCTQGKGGDTPGVGGTPLGPPAAEMPARAVTRDFREVGAAALPDAARLRSAIEPVTEPLKTELLVMVRLRGPTAEGNGEQDPLLRGGSPPSVCEGADVGNAPASPLSQR